MSFPRYPTYKPSGVEWLGEVPEHWEVKKIRNFASFTGGGTPSRENLSFWGGPIPWVSPKDMKVERIIEAEEGITQEGLDGSSSSLVAPGHVLIVVRSGILRHTIPVAINAVEVAINQDMKAVRMDDKVCTNIFFLRWIQGLNNQLLLAWAKQGATVESVEQEYLSKTVLPLPTLAEQAAIATFLDHETAKIDALIAEQQRLIELLQEKRQAVISHAVTKGLNPDAPMKDSGVEWLGEVPEHWSLVKLKHVAKDKVAGPYGASLTKSMYTHVGYRVYGQQQVIPDNFEEGDYYIDDNKYEEMKRYSVSPGDVLISVMGTVGKVAVVPDCVEPGIINPRLVRYHLRDLLIPRFAQRLLLSTPFQEKILLEAKGATMDGLNMQILGDLPLPLPPRAEQEAILDQLLRAMASFDAMASSTEQSVLLLRERRSALISAAVTGQIDVRGLVPEAVAA